jgi:Arc/MetJ-type ribon-helix-helix transcriptional regulator
MEQLESISRVAPYKLVQLRLPLSLATELDRAVAETTGSTSSYVRRAIFEMLQRDGFRPSQAPCNPGTAPK